MTKLYVTEYDKVATNRESVVPVAVQPYIAAQVVDYGAGEAHSAAFNASTRFISVESDAICSIKIAVNAVATTGNDRMIAGERQWFAVTPGQRISGITNS
jgi:hypothetical protein